MIMPQLIINTYVSLMYELKKMESYLKSKFIGRGPSSYKKRIYRGAVSQRLRNTAIQVWTGPKGSRRLRLPEFRTVRTWRRKLLHNTHAVKQAFMGSRIPNKIWPLRGRQMMKCVGRPLRKWQAIVVKWNPPYCTQSQLDFLSSLSHYQTTTVAWLLESHLLRISCFVKAKRKAKDFKFRSSHLQFAESIYGNERHVNILSYGN